MAKKKVSDGDDKRTQEIGGRLRQLVEGSELSRSDRILAERCLRRLEQPLRLTIFGTNPKHAISLANLMIGQPVISPSIRRARIQFLHGEDPHARLQFRDGSQKRLEGADFRRLFDDSPSKIRIYLDLSVLKKLSIQIASENNPRALCTDAEKSLTPADIAIFAGDELTAPVSAVWNDMHDRLRGHSYLVLSPTMEDDSWRGIAQDFVEVMRVDPRRAQDAKTQEGGVDKDAFRESGGAQIIRAIRKEIEVLVQSAVDASELLLLRQAEKDAELEEATVAVETFKPPVDTTTEVLSDSQAQTREEEPVELRPNETEPEDRFDQMPSAPRMREQVYSVPLGKVASRSRLLSSPAGQSVPEMQARHAVSLSVKNMPKRNVSRPISKTAPKSRVRSRRSGPSATPWSLGL